MKIILKDNFVYTPKWNSNDKLKKEDQVRIHFQFLNGKTWEELATESEDGKISGTAEFNKIVTKVENLTIEKDEKEIPATGLDIATKGSFFDLYLEAKMAYRNESTVGKETKKK